MSVAIKIENLSKQYRLGLVSTRTLSHDLNRWWQTSILGREDPYLKIGQENKLSRSSQITNHKSQITNLKSEEYVWALKDINLEVEEGEVLGIIGKNGAGKSTLLKILSKVTAPTTGVVKARGRIASLLEVGTGFHQEMTGRENIYMNGAIMGMTKAEIRKKFDEIVDFAGVERYIDTPVKRYSSGMTVRLGFAVAAHLEPEILVVDEVLAVGDAEFQKKAIGKMKEVSKEEGRTVLFVSHNMASMQALCKIGLILENGSIFEIGDINNIVSTYIKKLEGDSAVSFEDRENRIGTQELKISNIKFINTISRIEQDPILAGEPITIELNYVCNNPDIIKDCNVAIAFTDQFNNEKFVCASQFYCKKFQNRSKTGAFCCKIEKWPLNIGNYIFRFQVDCKGVILDRIENAGTIHVEYGDFFGKGYIVAKHLNGVLINHEWFD